MKICRTKKPSSNTVDHINIFKFKILHVPAEMLVLWSEKTPTWSVTVTAEQIFDLVPHLQPNEKWFKIMELYLNHTSWHHGSCAIGNKCQKYLSVLNLIIEKRRYYQQTFQFWVIPLVSYIILSSQSLLTWSTTCRCRRRKQNQVARLQVWINIKRKNWTIKEGKKMSP